jgi:hypothetical protein
MVFSLLMSKVSSVDSLVALLIFWRGVVVLVVLIVETTSSSWRGSPFVAVYTVAASMVMIAIPMASSPITIIT